MRCRTSAQKKGARMRAQGRNYRGGYTRGQIAAGEHHNQTCRVRGCTRRQREAHCAEHRDDGDSDDE